MINLVNQNHWEYSSEILHKSQVGIFLWPEPDSNLKKKLCTTSIIRIILVLTTTTLIIKNVSGLA